jgi:hypothetical protein
MEKHVLSKCDTVEINYKINLRDSNDDGILKKLNRGKTDKNKFYSQIQTKMKSKYIYLLYNF